TRAEGEKQAAITRSEGQRESAILQADGAAQAKLKAAAADSQAIAQIAGAIGSADKTTQYLLTSRYIESLRDMTQTNNSKVVFMPVETSSMFSGIGALKELLKGDDEDDGKGKLPPSPRSPRELNQ